MGVFEKKGLCLAVTAYEDDYLEFFEDTLGVCALVHSAARTEDKYIPHNLRYPFGSAAEIEFGVRRQDLDEVVAESRILAEVEAYRTRTGRKWPPLYRVRIVVSATDLGDAEAEKWWRARVARNATAADAGER